MILKTSAQFSKGMCDGLHERWRTAGEVTFSAEEWDITEDLETAPKAVSCYGELVKQCAVMDKEDCIWHDTWRNPALVSTSWASVEYKGQGRGTQSNTGMQPGESEVWQACALKKN